MSTIPSGIGGSLRDEGVEALLAGEELLQSDSIPDENQHTSCFSCDQKMVGVFCHACGQKNDDYRRSIWALITETFASIFSLENRIWRTWLTLIIKPGKVPRQFADGKRNIWTSPVRIYLAMSVILFGYMSITETRIFSVRTDIVPKAEMIGDVETLDDQSVRLKPDFGFFRRQAELDRLNTDVDFGRIPSLMKGTTIQTFVFEGDLKTLDVTIDDASLKAYGVWPESEDNDVTTTSTETSRKQALSNYTDSVEEALELYNNILSQTGNPHTIGDRILTAKKNGVTLDIINQLNPYLGVEGVTSTTESLALLDKNLAKIGLSRPILNTLPLKSSQAFSINLGQGTILGLPTSKIDVQRLFVQVLRNPAILNDKISRYLPRIMFLMMPLAALIGFIFIRGRETALLYDHLVHAAYIHAVTFGCLLIMILLSQWTTIKPLSAFAIGLMIYLPVSAKRMFNRGWFKTVLASYSIATIYGIVMFVIVSLLTAGSMKQAVLMSQL